jgi:folate-dependent phosphoribosylglycinamide formyltransferase PurN
MIINWVPFFSQTGSEIYNLCERLDIEPLFIITNTRPSSKRKINDNLLTKYGHIIYYVPNYPTVDDYNKLLHNVTNPLITLHGWLRIIPKDICNKYMILNGHPAPLHIYPELKGKDKQEDQYTYNNIYKEIGTVIHQVIPELDEGNIIMSNNRINTLSSVDDSYYTLHNMSFDLWCTFFKVYLLKQ